ncbi:MAG: 3-deoxy-manno-octulosonate cytidylyltransferase [Nitrospina sp.]|nr:MAG: 3-deoxy-manno-octulosonate cytidylyltransferase [Nitrospina sp.]TDJ59541.1 MAG: 3-deoxy-manno-octulosonate cytidylyltransferase [Nitrospina sp.]
MPIEPRAVAIIPARWASTRFPGKPLAQIQNKPMIQWVVEQAQKASRISEVIVATDDIRIVEAVHGFGGKAVMTSPDHATGSDRIAEVASGLKCDIVVNVQGDEPLIPPQNIDQVVDTLEKDPSLSVATLMMAINDPDEIADPHVVKVVADQKGRALYFSRSPIPFHRDEWKSGSPEDLSKSNDKVMRQVYKHIGLYAYTRSFVLELSRMAPTPLEQLEKLEQLRILEHGIPIQIGITEQPSMGVDHSEDLERVERFLEKQNQD